MTKTIAVTGASGFVGRELHKLLERAQVEIILLGRKNRGLSGQHIELDLSKADFHCTSDLYGVDTLIHLAAQTADGAACSPESVQEMINLNVKATIRLAEQAADANVKRFIFISSVKALGESTSDATAFTVSTLSKPTTAYGRTKADAEAELMSLAQRRNIEVTVIRAPLIYGVGAKANFNALLNLAKRNLPLPLASVSNARSMVAAENLADLILTCIDNPKAANQTFMISDDDDISTPELLRKMTIAHGKKPRLIPFPPSLLRLLAKLVGKDAIAERLLGCLQVDIEHTKSTLNWAPIVKLEDVLKEIVNDSSI